MGLTRTGAVPERRWAYVESDWFRDYALAVSMSLFEQSRLHQPRKFKTKKQIFGLLIYFWNARISNSKILGQQKRAGAHARGHAGGGDRKRRSSCSHRRFLIENFEFLTLDLSLRIIIKQISYYSTSEFTCPSLCSDGEDFSIPTTQEELQTIQDQLRNRDGTPSRYIFHSNSSYDLETK
jgi:hypothetical protein